MYYATCYSFKNTQKEDAEKWLIIGTTVIRRLQRMQAEATEKAAREAEARRSDAAVLLDDDEQDDTADFGKGLGHFLSAMCASLSQDVVSSTMAHLTVCYDGTRFQFSHDFVNMLVSQMSDVLNGKEGQFRIRSNYSKVSQRKVFWPDSTVDDYLHRSDRLEDGLSNLCLYQFVSGFKKVCKTFKEMNNKKNGILEDEADEMNDDYCSDEECDEVDKIGRLELGKGKFPFMDGHPGKEFAYLQELKHHLIPVISVPKDSLCRIEELEMHASEPSETALDKREIYAEMACLMFLPFRCIDDLRGDGW